MFCNALPSFSVLNLMFVFLLKKKVSRGIVLALVSPIGLKAIDRNSTKHSYNSDLVLEATDRPLGNVLLGYSTSECCSGQLG